MRSVAIILAGGQGKRMQSSVPKQYISVLGLPLIAHTIKAFEASFVEEIVLVVGSAEEAWVKDNVIIPNGFTKVTTIVEGGMERYDSVYNGLKAIVEKTSKEDLEDTVCLVHDGARACVDPDIINHVLYTVYTQKTGCIAAVPVKDTIKKSLDGRQVDETLNRDTLYIVQTPQGFMADALWEANQKMNALKTEQPEKFMALNITDDACIMEQFSDKKIEIVAGNYKNIKVTTPEDLLLAESFLK